MTSILSGILSVIVSVAMAFGGAGELPSVPETAYRVTVSDPSITVNGEEASADAAVTLTSATGADEWSGQIGAGLNGEELASVALKLTAYQLSAALVGSDTVYTLNEDTVGSIIGIETDETDAQSEDPDQSAVFEMIGRVWTDVCALANYCADADNAKDMRQQAFAVLLKDAQTADVSAEVDGAQIPGVQYDVNVTMDTVYDLYDWMETCGIEPLQNYVKDILDIISLSSGQEFTSVSEALKSVITEDVSLAIPLECVIAEADGVTYEKIAYSSDEGGSTGVTAESTAHADGTVDFSVAMASASEGDDPDTVEMNVTGNAVTADGETTSLELSADMARHYSYTDTYALSDDGNADADPEGAETGETSAETVYSFSTVSDSAASVRFGAAKAEGGWDVNGDIALTSSDSYQDMTSGEEPSVNTRSAQFSGSVVHTREADGSTTAKVSFGGGSDMGVGDEGKSDVAVSFNVNTAIVPYTDVTAEMTDKVELTADMTEVPESLNNDLAALTAAVAKLTQDDGIAGLIGMFNNAETVSEGTETSGDEADPETGTGEEDYISFDTVNSWSELASYLSNEVPEVTLPENYSFTYGFASKDGSYIDASVEDENGDLLYDISVSCFDFDLSENMLGDEDSEEIEGRTAVFYPDDDGNIVSAEIYDGNNDIYIYFFDPVERAAAVQIITDLL